MIRPVPVKKGRRVVIAKSIALLILHQLSTAMVMALAMEIQMILFVFATKDTLDRSVKIAIHVHPALTDSRMATSLELIVEVRATLIVLQPVQTISRMATSLE